MGTFIGIDGIPGGWVAVYADDKRALRFDHVDRLDRLLAVPHDRAAIDMPIGLPERGYRACDRAARRLVGASVFLGARWNLWGFQSYEQANAHYWANDDTGIARQLWLIRHKLREVNEAMTPERQSRLVEAHPELVFWRLNGGVCLDAKTIEAGRKRRIALLRPHGFDLIETWLDQRRGTGIGRDDLIDACACALAARESTQRLPDGAAPEARGLRMEIWY